MSSALELHLRRGERVTIIGKTGSGKSVALRWILAAFPRVILADPKGRAHLGDAPVVYGVPALRAYLRQLGPASSFRVIARPAPAEDRADWLNGVCRLAYELGELAIGIDEVVGIASSSRPVRWLDAVLTQGRELGVSAVVCTQRPKRIPPTLLSEADHVLVYRLARQDDRDAVEEVTGPFAPATERHGFVYWTGELEAAVTCRPLPYSAG